jgi:uncharacterized coiled-coil protein SlyX
MTDEISERLQRIEAHVAQLEHQADQLNDVIIQQGKTIDRLKKEVQRQSMLLQGAELERIKSNNLKPPHY